MSVLRTSTPSFVRAGLAVVLLALLVAPLSSFDGHTPPADLQPFVRAYEPPGRSIDPAAARALERTPGFQRFRAEAGPGWSVRADALRPGAAAILGGALPVLPGRANGLSWKDVSPAGRPFRDAEMREHLEDRARGLVRRFPELFGSFELVAPSRGAMVRGRDGRLVTFVMHQVHEGVPVHGTRMLQVLSGGNLIYLESFDLAPVSVPSTPSLTAAETLEALAGYLGGDLRGLTPRGEAELFYVPVRGDEGLTHRLVREHVLVREGEIGTWRALVDAHSGEVVAFEDRNRYACSLDPGDPPAKAIGGVRHDTAVEEEKVWGLTDLLVLHDHSQVTDFGGQFRLVRGEPGSSALAGRYFQVVCDSCPQPQATLVDGVIDFGTGGADATPNDTSTPAGRTTYYHLQSIRRLASKWIDVDWFDENVRATVNIDSNCNAFWDGEGVNFYTSGGGCNNTGEIRDVISHEWGHGLDQNDGFQAVDAARGEAISDVVASLLDRDSCVGESFRGDGTTCDGVRDMDENAAWPGLLTVSNVKATFDDCNRCCQGPLEEECHWEGILYGQAHWHLAQSLLNGVDAANPGLGPEAAWHVLERMAFGSTATAVTYLPWVHPQSAIDPPDGIPQDPSSVPGGTSTYLGYLLADDEGDGLANGTPHAAYVNEAFGHHEMVDDMDPATPELEMVPDAPNCTQPPDPDFTLRAVRDPSDGTPAVEITWTDVPEAATYDVYRARAATDGMLPVAQNVAPGVGLALDDAVDPGEELWYWVAAVTADGCISRGETKTSLVPGYPRYQARLPTILDGASGDGDGAPDIGETFDLEVPLANLGDADAVGVSASLRALDGSVRILDPGPVDYPDVVAGAAPVSPATPFRLQIAPDPALCGTPVELVLEVEAAEGCALVEPVTLLVEPDCTAADTVFLRYASALWDDGGDNLLAPGETAPLLITTTNIGSQVATTVEATLTALTPGVTVSRNPLFGFRDIAPGGSEVSRNPQPELTLDAGLTCGTTARFAIDYTTGQGAFSDAFALPVGETQTVLDDDFETDRGWTPASEDPLGSGQWVRADPAGSLYQPETGNPFGTPDTAWVTGASASTGDEVGDTTVTLTSPWLDLSGYDAASVSFARWVTLVGNHDDTLRLEISDDEFRNSVAVLEEAGNDPLWRNVTAPIPAGMLAPGVQLRFSVSDPGDNSLVEAAVDDLRLAGSRCGAVVAEGTLRFESFTVQDPVPFGNADGFADPGEAVTLRLLVRNPGGAPVDTLDATLSSPTPGVTVNDPATSFVTDPLDGGQFSASAPDHVGLALDETQLACGAEVELVFDLGWNGGAYTTPTQTLRVGQLIRPFEDDFEADSGWTTFATVDDPVRGTWQRVTPQGTFFAPGSDNPFGQGTMAFVTGNGSPGNFNEFAVWNNTVELVSPPMDLSDVNAARLVFFHDHREFRFGGGPPMPLVVEASTDGFATTELLAAVEGAGQSGWRRVEVDVPPLLLTDGVQLRFTVENDPSRGLVDSAVDDVAILADFCPGAPLEARFLHNGPVCDGDPARFTSVPAGDPSSLAIDWDLDGDATFGNLPEEALEDPALVYGGPGLYDVTLRVRDGQGGESTDTQTFEVRERPAPSIDQAPTNAEEEAVLDFAASATGGDGQYLFEWTFGDGNNATGAAVQHTYTQPGLYDVVLTVTDTDGAGCPETTSTQVEIVPNRPPDPIVGLRLVKAADEGPLDLSWDPDIRAEDYAVYAAALPSTAGGGLPALTCVDPPVTQTSKTIDTPEVGSRIYLVTGRNAKGEGTMDAPNAARGVPPSPCN